MTLVEVLVASVMALVLMLAVFAFLDAVTKSSANDQERSSTLVDSSEAVHDMVVELDQAFEYKAPALTSAGETLKANYVEVGVWVATTTASQQKRRLVFDCEEASEVTGEKACVRYETATSDKTAIAELSKDGSASRRVLLPRVMNTATSGVFELKSERGGTTPSYGQITIETPGAGKNVTTLNDHGYSYAVTLKDAFYLRNLEFKT